MNKNNKIKFAAGTIALSLLLSACKKDIDIFVVRDNSEHTKQACSMWSDCEFEETQNDIIGDSRDPLEIFFSNKHKGTSEPKKPEFNLFHFLEKKPEISFSRPEEDTEMPSSTETTEEQLLLEIIDEPTTEETSLSIETIASTESTQPILDDEPTPTEAEQVLTEEASAELSTTPTAGEYCEPEKPEELQVVYATTNLNLRTTNSTDGIKIGELKIHDAAYKIASCDNNWDLVKYGNKVGYVCRDYLDFTGETATIPYKYTLKKDIVLTTSKTLNLRETPSTDIKRMTYFTKGTEIEVIAEVDNGWYLVKNNGKIGYIHKDYTISLLEKVQAQYPELELDELKTQKVVCATEYTSVNLYPDEESEQLSDLVELETVRVMQEYGDWYLVMTNDYNFGFVNKNYTKEYADTFVIGDLSEQRIWVYKENELYYVTDEVSGKKSTPSDIGQTKVDSMIKGRYLSGADYGPTWVENWVGINDDGEGLHDSKRSVFGKEANHEVNGSHGCHNIPPETMEGIYKVLSIGDTVNIHR